MITCLLWYSGIRSFTWRPPYCWYTCAKTRCRLRLHSIPEMIQNHMTQQANIITKQSQKHQQTSFKVDKLYH